MACCSTKVAFATNAWPGPCSHSFHRQQATSAKWQDSLQPGLLQATLSLELQLWLSDPPPSDWCHVASSSSKASLHLKALFAPRVFTSNAQLKNCRYATSNDTRSPPVMTLSYMLLKHCKRIYIYKPVSISKLSHATYAPEKTLMPRLMLPVAWPSSISISL